MGLLQPESGLLFWMCLSFGVVLFVLLKFGFPVILRMVDERKAYIDRSIDAAHEAESRLENLEAESRALIEGAERERAEILRAADESGKQLLETARAKAAAEGERLRAEILARAEEERAELLRDARRQVALLAVSLTERMLREQLADPQTQSRMAERMLDEMERKTDRTWTSD